MSNKRVSGLCRCPYYYGERHNTILCEGIIAGTRCESRFKTPDDRLAYQDTVCASADHPQDYQLCPVFHAVTRLYEEG